MELERTRIKTRHATLDIDISRYNTRLQMHNMYLWILLREIIDQLSTS